MQLTPQGIPFVLDVLTDVATDPSEAVSHSICATAEQQHAAAVVMVEHGHAGHVLLGDVTEQVITNCTSPVILLHGRHKDG